MPPLVPAGAATHGAFTEGVADDDAAMKKSAMDVASATWSACRLRIPCEISHCQVTLPGVPGWLYGPPTCPCR